MAPNAHRWIDYNPDFYIDFTPVDDNPNPGANNPNTVQAPPPPPPPPSPFPSPRLLHMHLFAPDLIVVLRRNFPEQLRLVGEMDDDEDDGNEEENLHDDGHVNAIREGKDDGGVIPDDNDDGGVIPDDDDDGGESVSILSNDEDQLFGLIDWEAVNHHLSDGTDPEE